MNRNIIKKDILRIISITYLIVFCILKLLMLTNVCSNISINTIMFVIGCLIFLLMLINKRVNLRSYPILLKLFVLAVIINTLFNLDIETIKSGLFEIFYVLIVYNIAYTYLRDEDLTNIIRIILILSTLLY